MLDEARIGRVWAALAAREGHRRKLPPDNCAERVDPDIARDAARYRDCARRGLSRTATAREMGVPIHRVYTAAQQLGLAFPLGKSGKRGRK